MNTIPTAWSISAPPLAHAHWRQWVCPMLILLAINATTFDFARPDAPVIPGGLQTAMRLMICTLLGLYGFRYLAGTWRQFLILPGAWLTLLIVWSLITAPWSRSVSFTMAAIYALVCFAMFAPAAIARLGSTRLIQTLVNSLLLFVGVNWAMFLVMPRLGTSPFQMPDESVIYRFGNDSQQLGIQIAWTAALILWQVYRGERTWRAAIVPMGFLLATLPMTQSRTAALTTAVALGTVVWTYTNGPRRVLFALVAMFSLFGVGILLSSGVADEFAANVAAKISRSGNAEELSNFTGRDVIWQWAWQEAWKTPLTGCGYGASRFVMDVGPFSFDPDHAHNLWLNTFLTIGIPGVCLLAAMWLHLAMGLLGRGDALPNVAAMVVFVAGVSEPILLGPMPRSHVMIWFIALFWTQMTRAESRIDRLSAGEIV